MNNFYRNNQSRQGFDKVQIWRDRPENIARKVLEDLIKLGEDLPEDHRRGLSEETVKEFKLFHITHEHLEELKDKYSAQELINSGLFKYECQICEEGYRKTFTSREKIQAHIKGGHNSGFEKLSESWLKPLLPEECILIPYLDDKGNPVYINSRDLNWSEEKETGKYRRPHHDSEEAQEFFQDGLYQATGRDSDILVITEGEFDALAAYEEGYDAVAIAGVSTKTETRDRLAEICKDYEEVVYVADNDIPGLEALGVLSGELRVRGVEIQGQISEGEDLSDQVEKGESVEVEGRKVTDILMKHFEKLMDNEDKLNMVSDAEELFYHSLFDLKKTRWKPKVKALADRMGEILEDKPDKQDLKKECEKYLKELSEERKKRKLERNKKEEKTYQINEEEARKFLKQENVLEEINKEIGEEMTGEKANRKVTFLSALSSFLDRKINIRGTGESGAGKSHILNTVSNFLPEEMFVMKKTRVTPTYFEHALQGKDLDGKIILIQEFEATGDGAVNIRPMLSGDQEGLDVGIVDKNEKGQIESRDMRATGIPVFWTASTDLILDKEFETRTWKIETDESKEQTRKVLKFEAKEDKDPDSVISEKRDIIQDSIRYLRDNGIKKVKNLYAPFIAEVFPREPVRLRRDFKKFLGFLKAHAFLHQFSRPIIEEKGEEKVVVTAEDYKAIRKMVQDSFNLTVTNMDNKLKEAFNVVEALIKEDGYEKGVTKSEVAKELELSRGTVGKYLNSLCDLGHLDKEPSEEDKRKKVYRLSEAKKSENIGIPTFKEILKEKGLKEAIKEILGIIREKNLNRRYTLTKKNGEIDEWKFVKNCLLNIPPKPGSEIMIIPILKDFGLNRQQIEELAEKIRIPINSDNLEEMEEFEDINENKSETERSEKEENEENKQDKQNIEDLISEDSDVGPAFDSIYNYMKETGEKFRVSKVQGKIADKFDFDSYFIGKQLEEDKRFKVENNRIHATGD